VKHDTCTSQKKMDMFETSRTKKSAMKFVAKMWNRDGTSTSELRMKASF
jgi:hypothetical protein